MSDRIRDIQNRMKGVGGGGGAAAAIAYVPLFGWIYPFYAKKDDELCRFHGKQGMQLNALMLAVYTVVFVLEHFPIVSFLFGPGQFFNAITQAVWRITALAYIGLSIYCALKAFEEEKWAIPHLDETINKAVDHVKGG